MHVKHSPQAWAGSKMAQAQLWFYYFPSAVLSRSVNGLELDANYEDRKVATVINLQADGQCQLWRPKYLRVKGRTAPSGQLAQRGDHFSSGRHTQLLSPTILCSEDIS